MGKVLEFPPERQKDAELVRLKEASDQIDQVVLDAIRQKGIAPTEMAGILAHRLGSLIRHLDQNDALLGVCERVIKRQAGSEQ